ncbi:hypothetical protein HDC94_000976 [Leifsonia sp. AK011]|nr:hypothetical protein [Leifsonia sp. AK011]NYF09820.1 hypothetical protein [Leifsonia sp. AK011]
MIVSIRSSADAAREESEMQQFEARGSELLGSKYALAVRADIS